MTEEETAPIISHMNDDHTDAIMAYVLAFADFEKAKLPAPEKISSALMTGIDDKGIDLSCTTPTGEIPVRIKYSDTGVGESLESASGARKLLVDMVKEARKRLD
ncbi:MAG: DUF2470 domain-containing protein [Verrucomicrobiales bacterium]|nr:DUF2470 domain-containing protein [Verrucomicrobiales bacterium]